MSNVDPLVPATGTPIVSEEIRENFSTIKTELEALQSGSIANTVPPVVQGRLTTESGVAISTSDRSSQSTLYFTPYRGAQISLYDGSSWQLYTFTEASLALSGLTSGKCYDVFAYWNSGSLALALGSAWTSATVRADALGTQNGIYVKGSDATYLHVGVIYTSSTTATDDSKLKRNVGNAYNQVYRPVYLNGWHATSWTYATATYRRFNNDSTKFIQYTNGSPYSVMPQDLVLTAKVKVSVTPGYGSFSIYKNGSQFSPAGSCWDVAAVYKTPGVYNYISSGMHYFEAWEYVGGGGTILQEDYNTFHSIAGSVLS